MAIDSLLSQAETKMAKAIEHLENELRQLRTGRASAALVEDIKIDVYGQPMVLKQVASITVPDAKSIAIVPWDRANLAPIEKALRDSSTLGLNPVNDGNAIRLNIPPLTEERRRDIVKQMKEKVEHSHISLRNVRHEVLDQAREMEKQKLATQDDVKSTEQALGKLMDQMRLRTSQIETAKEHDLMEV